MANFFLDNDDIQFHFQHGPFPEIARAQEDGFAFHADCDYAPADADDAVDNYRRALAALGELAGEHIAPAAEDVDREGSHLDGEQGRVAYARGIQQALDLLRKADMTGFTLEYKYGGLNFPNLVYSVAIEIVSRADASLMNLFGLQGIAETIQAFADEDMRNEYLPRFSSGEVTGAMVLTEPDAGSDLQQVKLKASPAGDGTWRLNGVKRFITNGCGDILLVLARSEEEESGGLGLSLFLVERGPHVRVRRIEDKLGIHGSPTCELVFTDSPGRLIGERKRGLVTYVMALMNGARVGIGAQAVGIGQAAYQVARQYAYTRQQFGVRIEQIPAVANLLVEMRLDLEAARAILYETSRAVDLERAALRRAEGLAKGDGVDPKAAKRASRELKRTAGMLTPICKYYCSEMCQRVTSLGIQVLGGSGYMRDYPLERLFRDARITTIYEGTSQLQIVAAVLSVISGTAEKHFTGLADNLSAGTPAQWSEALAEARSLLQQATEFVKSRGAQYRDLYARELVDAAIDILIGYLFARDAAHSEHKAIMARKWIGRVLSQVRTRLDRVLSGDTSTLKQYLEIVGPVPEA